MYHVTRCPNCHTSFRLTEAHLAAFDGKVRCGRCAFVFDAREHFVGEPAPTPAAPPITSPAPVAEPAPIAQPAAVAVATPAPFAASPVVPPETAPATSPAAVETHAHDDDAHLYGLDSMASQLGAAAQVEREEADSLASRSLEQLAQALGNLDALAPPAAPHESMLELNLDMDMDGSRGDGEAHIPVDTAAAAIAPNSTPAATQDEHELPDLMHPPKVEVDVDLSPEAFEVWSGLHAQQTLSAPAMEHDAAESDLASHAFQHATSDVFDDLPPIRAHDEPFVEDQSLAPITVTSEAPITAIEPAVEPISSGAYRPILTAEDERLLRVPGGPSPWRWLWSIPAFLALIVLVGQIAYRYRTDLSVQLPGIKPNLERFCAITGCKLDLPARAEFLRTEWVEVKPLPDRPNILQVDAVLRNQASFDQALPLLELTLTDDADRIVAKKVFDPRSYLAPLADGTVAPLPASVVSNGDLRIFLQIDMGNLHSGGYSINWFYPTHN